MLRSQSLYIGAIIKISILLTESSCLVQTLLIYTSHCLSRYNIHTKELETIFKSQYFDYSYLYSVVPGRPLALNSRWAVWTDGLLDKIQVYDINKREWVFSLDDDWFHSLNDNDLLVCGKTYTSIEGYSRKEFYIYDLLGNSVYQRRRFAGRL